MPSKIANESIFKCSLNETTDKLDLSFWDLPEAVIIKYNKIGIKRMFEWQAQCLMSGSALNGGNLIYSAPTSAGKTLVAELLMLKRVLETKKKAIMILPYVSVAREKMKHLQSFGSDLNIRVDGFIGNNNPNGGFNCVDVAICTIEKANSLINRLIEDNKISDLGVLVIDELHMVGDSSRGYLLELLLTKIKYLTVKYASNENAIQIIGMSATLPNLNLLSNWLNASLYQTSFRPVPLIEQIKYGNNLFDNSFNLLRQVELFKDIDNDNDLLLHLTYETIRLNLGVLIFCPAKARCETIAENIAKMLYKLDKMKHENAIMLNKEQLQNVHEQLKRTPAGLDPQLGKCICYGVAFHHAGLTIEERDIIETSFKEGVILVIVATSTLSSGVNLPARRVIIRTPIFNGHLLDTMTYRQMIGRAGRKGIDTIGESILMCNNPQEKRQGEELIKSQLAPIKSCLTFSKFDEPNAVITLTTSIKRAILEIIASGIANEITDLTTYLTCTLLNAEYNQINTNNNINQSFNQLIEQSLQWLIGNEFISKVKLKPNNEKNDKDMILKATPLGSAVLASSMSPDEGLVIFKELQKALQCFVLENELQIIYEVTPINICDYWLNVSSNTASSTLSCKLIDWNYYLSIIENFSNDKKRVANLVGVRESFIMKMIRGKSITSENDKNLLKIHLRFYTSLILNDLVNEVSFSRLIDEYKCQKGFLQQLQQSAATYAGMITIFCNRMGWFNLELLITQFQSRLTFGVQRELCDLMQISLLNSYRARLLYNNGYTNIKLLASAEPNQIEKIFRATVIATNSAAMTKMQNFDSNNKLFETKYVWNDGKFYTNWEASNVIVNEAKTLLLKDVEFLGLKLENMNKIAVEENNLTTNSKLDDNVHGVIVDDSQKESANSSSITSPKADLQVTEQMPIQQPIQSEQLSEQIIEQLFEKTVHEPNVKLDESINSKSIHKKQDNIEIIKTPLANKASYCEKNVQDLSSSFYNLSINESDLDAAAVALAHQLTSNKIEHETRIIDDEPSQQSQPQIGSYFDNQNMILLANQYDNEIKKTDLNVSIVEKTKKSNEAIINSTVISDEILEICEMYENNKDLFKTPITPKTPKYVGQLTPKLSQSPRMQRIDKALETPKYLKDQSTFQHHEALIQLNMSNNEADRELINQFLKIIPKNLQSNINIFILSSESDYDNLSKILTGLKTFLSISIAYESEIRNEKNLVLLKNIRNNAKKSLIDVEDEMKKFQFMYFDEVNNVAIKLNKIFLSFYKSNTGNSQLIQVYVIDLTQLKSDKLKSKCLNFLKNLCQHDGSLEKIEKVSLKAKEKLKLIIKVFQIEVKRNFYDPLIAYWLLENQLICLNDLRQKYCSNNLQTFNIVDMLKQFKKSFTKALNMYSLESEISMQEAFIEALICLNSMDKLKLKLQLDNLWNYYTKIESEILIVASYMELNGIGFDLDECNRQMNIIKLKQNELEKKIYSYVKSNKKFSLNSPEDIANLLYVELKLTPPILLDTVNNQSNKRILTTNNRIKHHSTAKPILEILSEQHELPKLILEWRQIQNSLTKTIYPIEKAKCFNKFLNMYRIHSSSDMCTLTGRLVLNEPCLQIIPRDYEILFNLYDNENDENENDDYDSYIRDKFYHLLNNDNDDDDEINNVENKKISISLRNSFIPFKNAILLSADYCQLELRIIAHLCKDKLLQKIINNENNDVFLLMASQWLNLPLNHINDTQRQQTKQIVYGIIYGVSSKTLSKLLNTSENDASVFIETFKSKFPSLKNYIFEQLELCRKNSYVETIKKRKRYLPNINSTNISLRQKAERQAINTIIQGSAADLVKTAMIKIDKQLNKKYPDAGNHFLRNAQLNSINNTITNGAYLVLQMHDELIYELNEANLNDVYDIVKTNMENCIKFDVKMRVKIKVGKTWGSLKAYNK